MKSASMTPFKRAPAGQRLFASLNDDDMEAESDSVESPPSNARQRSAMKPNTRSRLFEDDSDDFSLSSVKAEDQRNGRTPVRSGPSKILRPLDLNFSFDDEDADDMAAPVPTLPAMHTSEQHLQQPHHQDRQRRTRRLQKFAESGRRGESQTPTRLYGGLDADNAMASSPYVSPSSYMMTMDGRCVTSKNPFSPMVTEDSNAAAAFPTNGVAPSFPVSFDTNTSDPACPSGALSARHRLQKRDASTWSSPSKRSFLYASFTRDGYPERSGRYSFTGSPIKENEVHNQNHMDISTSSTSPSTMAAATKIRRLGMQEDVHYANNNSHENGRRDLVVDTTNAGLASSNSFEEVSPTDVMSFPAPPTPTKTRKSKSPFLSTPNPPETPSISRSGRRPRRRMGGGYGSANSSDMDDSSNENYSSGENAIKSMTGENSRFKSDFDVIGELGKGSFGAVYKVLSRLDGCMYAVKTALRQFKGEADRARMLKEVYALAALSDQADPATFHIVRYHQAWMEESRLYIQTELCSSNLADEIQSSGGRLSADRRYKLLREMLLALEFIHRKGNGMCHLDIKPENIFVKRDPPTLNVFKLGDFGLVAKIAYHKDVEEGDSRYMSMELLSGDHQDLTKSDIFSLGATLYEVSLGRSLPMNGSEWQEIRAGRLQPLPPDTPYEMEMIIREMMNPTYANRPSAQELLKRPQLLSKEQKMLVDERNKVFRAQRALAEQAKQMQNNGPPSVPVPGALIRRNTALF